MRLRDYYKGYFKRPNINNPGWRWVITLFVALIFVLGILGGALILPSLLTPYIGGWAWFFVPLGPLFGWITYPFVKWVFDNHGVQD